MHLLHTVFYKSSVVMAMRICLKIKSYFTYPSLLLLKESVAAQTRQSLSPKVIHTNTQDKRFSGDYFFTLAGTSEFTPKIRE